MARGLRNRQRFWLGERPEQIYDEIVIGIDTVGLAGFNQRIRVWFGKKG